MLRKAPVIAVMLATTTAIAACGGTSPTNNSKLSTQATHKNAGLKLAKCMRSHGVPGFPDPQNGGGFGVQASPGGRGPASITVGGHTLNVSGPAFQHAMRECQKNFPQGPPISGAQLAKIRQGALKMAECMRRHGVRDFPDPQVTTGPGGHGIQVRIGMGSAGGSTAGGGKAQGPPPAVQHAMTICQPLMGGLKRRTA